MLLARVGPMTIGNSSKRHKGGSGVSLLEKYDLMTVMVMTMTTMLMTMLRVSLFISFFPSSRSSKVGSYIKHQRIGRGERTFLIGNSQAVSDHDCN